MIKKTLKVLGVLLLIVLIYLVAVNYKKTNIITGYAAKYVASSNYLAGRNSDFTMKTDLDFSPINQSSNTIDDATKTTVSKIYNLGKRKAIYKEGLGCILVNGDYNPKTKMEVPNRNTAKITAPNPFGNQTQLDTVFQNVDYNRINKAVDEMFDTDTLLDKNTRSVLVIYKNQIIAEKYAAGFDKESILLGWSMTKSITSTLIGILEKQGKVDLQQDHLFPEWNDDKRAQITLNDLVHMNSGLEWEEDYTKISDATKMLFLDTDMSRAQLVKPAVYPPDSHWNYSSGTTNLLSGFIRNQFPTQQAYLDFWYNALIDKIGMHSMTVETDQSGHFVGSSYGWATTRDWAKLGLLYLHQGNWNGSQVIDTSWVNYTATPTNDSNGEYGGHFWLNAGGIYPDAPKDIYSANGFQNQRVFICPSDDLVVVRLGLKCKNSKVVFNRLLTEVSEAVE